MKLDEISANVNDQFLNNKVKIARWLKLNDINKYKINKDLTVDVFQDVKFDGDLDEYLPVQFGRVSGMFAVQHSNLISMRGFPKECERLYLNHSEHLTSIEHFPERIGLSACLIGCKNINSLEGINDYLKEMGHASDSKHNGIVIDAEYIHRGGLGLVHVKGNFKVADNKSSKQLFEPFDIINKYIGRPEDLFECQAELIDKGFEEFAKL